MNRNGARCSRDRKPRSKARIESNVIPPHPAGPTHACGVLFSRPALPKRRMVKFCEVARFPDATLVGLRKPTDGYSHGWIERPGNGVALGPEERGSHLACRVCGRELGHLAGRQGAGRLGARRDGGLFQHLPADAWKSRAPDQLRIHIPVADGFQKGARPCNRSAETHLCGCERSYSRAGRPTRTPWSNTPTDPAGCIKMVNKLMGCIGHRGP